MTSDGDEEKTTYRYIDARRKIHDLFCIFICDNCKTITQIIQ